MVTNLSSDFLAGQAGSFEPQREYNFFFEIGLDTPQDTETILLALEGAFTPSVNAAEVDLRYLNETRYVAGPITYDTGTLRLKDFVDRNTASVVTRWHNLVYDPIRGSVGLARNYKKTANIRLFGPDGSFERVWELRGVWPQGVRYGNLDMTSTGKGVIEVTVRYDKAIPLVTTLGPLGLAASIQGSLSF